MNILTDDVVDLYHQVNIGCRLTLFLQFTIDGSNCLILLSDIQLDIFPVGILHQADEFGGIGLEGFLLLDAGGYRICRSLQQRQLFEIPGIDQCSQVETVPIQKRLRCSNGFQNTGNQFILIDGRIGTTVSGDVSCIVSKSFPQSLDNANVIDNQAITLALCQTVSAGNRLH